MCKHVHLSNSLPNIDCPLKHWINEDSLNHMFYLICPTKKYITWQSFVVFNLQNSILLKCVQNYEIAAGKWFYIFVYDIIQKLVYDGTLPYKDLDEYVITRVLLTDIIIDSN